MLTIHQRYHHLVQDKPHVLASQAGLIGATTPPARDAATEVVEQARARMSHGDLEGAARTLSASMELARQSADLLLTLADVFLAQRKSDVADQVLQQAALLHPQNQAIRARLQRLPAAGNQPRQISPPIILAGAPRIAVASNAVGLGPQAGEWK
jgi:thioredoxin-like negative regulator of GroEL